LSVHSSRRLICFGFCQRPSASEAGAPPARNVVSGAASSLPFCREASSEHKRRPSRSWAVTCRPSWLSTIFFQIGPAISFVFRSPLLPGRTICRSGAAFAWNSISANRAINFPGFTEQATTRYGAGEAQIFGELGYGVSFGQIAAEPFAGLAWVHLRTDNFNEIGGVSALNGSGNNCDTGYSTLGMRAASYYLLQNGMAFIPRASIAWQHAFSTVDPTAALAFVSTGAPFTVAGVPLARDAALVEAGADLQITGNAKVGISYAGQLSNSLNDHSVKGNFTWRF
jgi:hypothetical protein